MKRFSNSFGSNSFGSERSLVDPTYENIAEQTKIKIDFILYNWRVVCSACCCSTPPFVSAYLASEDGDTWPHWPVERNTRGSAGQTFGLPKSPNSVCLELNGFPHPHVVYTKTTCKTVHQVLNTGISKTLLVWEETNYMTCNSIKKICNM